LDTHSCSLIVSDEEDLSAAKKKELKEQDKEFSDFFGKGKLLSIGCSI
jgi:hypothetical protein